MNFSRKERPKGPGGRARPRSSGHRGEGGTYGWLLTARGTSGLGNGMVLVAFPLLATTLTRRPLEVAGVAVAGQLPWLVVSLPAGALADRVERRRLLVGVELSRAIVLTGLGLVVLAGRSSLALLYLAAFIVGALETAFSAATRASLPALVRVEDLPTANGHLFAAETAGEQFAGPALGGLIFAWSASLPFFGDAVSFAGSAALLAKAFPSRSSVPPSRPAFAGDVRTGLRWFRHHVLLRRLALVVASFAFCQAAVLSVIVLYGLHVLHLTTAGYGLFLALGASGDILGSLLARFAHDHLGPARAIIVAGLAAAGGYLLLASTSEEPIALCGYALEAAAVALGNVATVSLRQRLIPAELFGRVDNAFRTCVLGSVPAGAAAGGLLATRIGLHATFLLAGLLQLAVIALAAKPLVAGIARSA